MQFISAGIPLFIFPKSSNFPTKTILVSLCINILFKVSALKFGYKGTETWPLIIIAKSLIIQCAQFLDSIAILLFSSKFKLFI